MISDLTTDLGRNLSREVDLLDLDTLAHFEADERQHFGTGILHQLAYLDFRVLDEGLFEEAVLGEILADPAGHHFLDDLGGLAALRRLGGVDLFLFGNEFGGHVFRLDHLRVDRGHVHRHVLGQLVVAAAERCQDSDTVVAVHIGTHDRRLNQGNATNADVFADLLHQRFASHFQLTLHQRGNVVLASGESLLHHGVDERQEVFIAGDKVGFTVDLDHHTETGAGLDRHYAVRGRAPGFLRRLHATGLAQLFNRQIDVAVGFHQRFLAFHHAKAGTLAELFHQGC